jgi:Na+-driven multidrug efflux pump
MSALYLSAARFFVFYVPLAWLLGNWLGLTGVFAGAALGNLLMAWISWSTVKRAVQHESAVAAQLQ